MAREIVDITVQVHARTERAILVSDDGERDKAKWLPLSQCEVVPKSRGQAVVTMPEWLAVENGFV